MPQKLRKNNLIRWDAAFALCIAAFAAFLVWKAPYGYLSNDEAFYLTIPYRMLQGDVLFINEWHGSQLTGLLLCPLLWLYFALGGTSEGVVLCFRYMYAAAQVLSAVYIYILCRRGGERGCMGALAMLCVYVPYAPHYIAALSYNTMGIMLLLLAGITAAERKNNAEAVLSGLMFAGAVLCCPYLAAVYAVYFAAVLINGRNGALKKSGSFTWTEFIYVTAGIAILSAIFLLYVLCNVGIGRLILSIPHILGDPEHRQIPIAIKLQDYAERVFINDRTALFSFAACAVLLIAAKLDKKRHGAIYMIAASLVTCLYLIKLATVNRFINFFSLPGVILGAVSYSLLEDRPRKIFAYVFIPGVMYSVLVHLSSNNNIYAISAGMLVATAASMYFAACLAAEMWRRQGEKQALNRLSAAFIAAAVLLEGGIIIYYRAQYSYGNVWSAASYDKISTLTEKAESGVGKGLYFNHDEIERYYKTIAASESVREDKSEKVLYFAEETWLYLADSKRSASLSAWLSVSLPEQAASRLIEYWMCNPDKLPDIMYISKDYTFNSDAAYDDVAKMLTLSGYTMRETDGAYIISNHKTS